MSEKKNSTRIFKILILAAILILPGFLYYLLEKEGKNSYKPLPIYGEKLLTGTFTSKMGEKIPDTAYHLVPISVLTNQSGEAVAFPMQDTSISVVNFFYTRCESFCQHMNDEMDRVATRFINNPKVRFYTLTVDTLYDTPAVLAAYSGAYQPSGKKWEWLTNGSSSGSDGSDVAGGSVGVGGSDVAGKLPGGSRDVLAIARNGYLVDALQDTTREAAFIHSSSLILVDSRRRIRGYYDVNHKKEVDRLIDEIKLLLVEEVRLNSPY